MANQQGCGSVAEKNRPVSGRPMNAATREPKGLEGTATTGRGFEVPLITSGSDLSCVAPLADHRAATGCRINSGPREKFPMTHPQEGAKATLHAIH
jgi:hypothetical protein